MKKLIVCLIGLLAGHLGAEEQPIEKNELQVIMTDLMSQSLIISESILLNDFEKIQQAAEKIAQHPKPSKAILSKIKTQLSSDMPGFKQFDMLVHHSAEKIVKHAKSREIELVMVEYLQMYQGCFGCHTKYKEKVSTALK